MRARILKACERAGREPDEVTLVAVTKGQNADTIQRVLLDEGQTILAENRIQEWRAKAGALVGAKWHFIGNLQTNKVRYCQDFRLIHSVNSERLADALEAFGAKRDHVFKVLLEVNVSGEASKQGAALAEVPSLVSHLQGLPHIELRGLMTMAPYAADPEVSRPSFRKLRELRDKLGLKELSMGMSGDFEIAIEEGATYVRVGTALFEGTTRAEGAP